MKRTLFTLLAAVTFCLAAVAKDNSTPLVVQLYPDETDALPQNTIELRLKNLTFSDKADTAFTSAVTSVITLLSEADSHNYIYTLKFTPGSGGETEITVNSLPQLTTSDMRRRDFYGVLSINRARFIVISTPENKKLLKSTFRQSGKHNIVQEYEMVDLKRPDMPAMAFARWTGNGLRIVTINADGTEHANGEPEPLQ